MIHATSLVLAEYRRKWPDPLILHSYIPTRWTTATSVRWRSRGIIGVEVAWRIVVFMVGLLVERHPSLSD